jgi:hypothetical protein
LHYFIETTIFTADKARRYGRDPNYSYLVDSKNCPVKSFVTKIRSHKILGETLFERDHDILKYVLEKED